MFMKQYNYKPRSASTSSQGSQSGSPPKEDAKPAAAVDNTAGSGAVSAGIAGRRRSSAAGAEKFAGLNAYKRGSQDDKKASFHEQKVGGGILGGMWDSFTKK